MKSYASVDGEGWSDSRISVALEASVSMVYRVRKQFTEGLEAASSRNAPAVPFVRRVLDGRKVDRN